MTLAGLLLFTLLAADVHFHGRLAQCDGIIARNLYQHMSGGAIFLFAGISGMGELKVIGPLTTLLAIVLILQRKWRTLTGWLAAMLGSAALCSTLKNAFAVPRPHDFTTFVFQPGSGFSFPSGHTMSVAIFAGALVMVIMHRRPLSPKKRTALWLAAAVLAVLEATALLLIGVHFLTDVLGGLAISLAWLGVIRMILPPRPPMGSISQEVHHEINRRTDPPAL